MFKPNRKERVGGQNFLSSQLQHKKSFDTNCNGSHLYPPDLEKDSNYLSIKDIEDKRKIKVAA